MLFAPKQETTLPNNVNENQPEFLLFVGRVGQLPEYFPPLYKLDEEQDDPDADRLTMEERHSILGKTGTGSLGGIWDEGDELVNCNNGNIDCSSLSFMV